MKKHILTACLLLGVVKFGLGQNFALNWHFSRFLDFYAPSIVLGAELNAPYSKRKTLQVSMGIGRAYALQEQELSSFAFRYGIEQKHFLGESPWLGRYLSVAFEARHLQILTEEWVNICDTGNCFQEIQNQRAIRNSYNLMGRIGRIRRLGNSFYYDTFVGLGAKLTKKTGRTERILFSENIPFEISKNHYLFPAFSLGFRVGFILK